MADLLTTLHPINDDTTDLYPNIKRDNLPQNVKNELDAIPGKVDKEQGKGLSTNDFTNEDKALVDTIPDKVDKVNGKGLSTNDFTNADKALVATIPGKVDKVQGKGLSTNDYTNEDKTALTVTIPNELSSLRAHILNLYRMVIRSGAMITVTDASVALTSQPFPLTVSPKALLDYVGGMCQKVNQLVVNGNFDGTSGWTTYLATLSASGNVGTFLASGQNGAVFTNVSLPQGHKFLVLATIQTATATDKIALKIQNAGSSLSQTSYCASTTAKQTLFIFFTNSSSLSSGAVVIFDNRDSGWDSVQISNVRLVDITAIYGAGNEPTTTSDARIQWLMSYLASHPEYDAGSILTAPVTMIVSKGNVNIYYPIHPDIQALDGYGVGKDAEHYNYIDFDRKVFVKETEIDGDDIVVLAEPVETDISNLLVLSFPTYDIINVLPGGHLEFQNDNNIGVPYSVTYQSKPDVPTTVQTIAPTAISEVDSNDPTDTI